MLIPSRLFDASVGEDVLVAEPRGGEEAFAPLAGKDARASVLVSVQQGVEFREGEGALGREDEGAGEEEDEEGWRSESEARGEG